MKHFISLILCLSFFTCSYGQQQKPVPRPEYSPGAPEEETIDKIVDWYFKNLKTLEHKPDSMLKMMELAMEWAEAQNDPGVQTCMTGLTGLFFREQYQDTAKAWTYFNKALAMCKQYNLRYQQSLILHEMGMWYRNVPRNYAKALECFLLADQLYDQDRESEARRKRDEKIGTRLDLINLYFLLGNHGSVLQLLPVILNADTNFYVGYNTLGLSYRETGRFDSAIFYFRVAMQKAHQLGSVEWVGLAAGNLATTYLRQQQYDSAKFYGELSYNLVKDNNSNVSGATKADILVDLAAVNVNLHNPEQAMIQLTEAERLMNGPQLYPINTYIIWYRLYKNRLRAYGETGNYGPTYELNKKLRHLKDSIDNVKQTSLYTKVQVQLQADKNIANIKKLEAEAALSVKRRNYVLIVLVLSGLVLFNLYRRRQLSNKKKLQLYDSREQLLHDEKVRTEEQFNSYLDQLLEKNKVIEEFEKQIERMKAQPNSIEQEQSIETLEKLKQTTIITEDDWLRFRSLFEKVHKGFFVRLKEKYPDITPAETRLLALAKLNISNTQMAGMLGISKDSIRMTGYRFMKKINMAGETNLSEIVTSI
jgi:tetratricopeptide (TPR) repeat protein/DNA-binding CsgD family transcriptional regulator